MDEEISVIIYDKQIKSTQQGGKMKKLKLLAAVGFGAVSFAGLAGSAVYAEVEIGRASCRERV